LFDTKAKAYGGTGEKFEWNLIKKQPLSKSYFLSGGIGPDDVEKIKEFCSSERKIFSLDVNSVFEISPGIKDMAKVRLFNESIKSNIS